VTHIWNFGTPLISQEPLKLETSNLALRWTAVSSNEKNAKLGQKGSYGGHVAYFLEFWDPPNISRLVEARNFKFGTETDAVRVDEMNSKLGQKGSCGGHVTYFWNFGTP